MSVADKIRPLGDRLVVKRLEAEQKTASGIIIPDNAKEKPQQGEVLAVGPGKWNEDGDARMALDVKVGDKVLFGKWSATDVKLDGEELLILKEDDVIAVMQ
ncbi:MAG: co-chaperone GroES [Alphaproteobacteria bacterium CG_4_10_14_0_8_um_filter_53_9]|nr:MAG: co-chaperone GroES [Alphaproteobacteria bacterium CG_4_10_14_0_8_um_filter_53_9]